MNMAGLIMKNWWTSGVALLALLGCSSTPPVATVAPLKVNHAQGRYFKFANDDRMREHWQKHGSEFGENVTIAAYMARAQAFFLLMPPEVELKHRPNGDDLRYRESTNEFGVLSSAGVIRTYFRPDTGRRYWEKQ